MIIPDFASLLLEQQDPDITDEAECAAGDHYEQRRFAIEHESLLVPIDIPISRATMVNILTRARFGERFDFTPRTQ